MKENTSQYRTGSLLSDVAVLFLLIILGTVAVVWLSTLTIKDFHSVENKFSAVSFLIMSTAGAVLCLKANEKFSEMPISKRAKRVRIVIAVLLLVVVIPTGMSYLTQYTMDQLYPVLHTLLGNNVSR